MHRPALLAAHLARVTYLTVGNGFAIPPARAPWPSIQPWATISDEALTHAEAALNRVTDAAQKALGHTTAVRVRDLFGPRDILDTFAEIDHYGARPGARYIGPIVSVPDALQVTWQNQERPKVLAYLRPAVPGFTAIVKALTRLDAQVLCIAPGLTLDAAKSVATRRFRVALEPVNLSPLLDHADLAVGYGNCGFSSQALLAGVPMAMRPRYVEQALLAQRVEALGAGKLLNGPNDADNVTASLQDLLHRAGPRQAARAFRDRYRTFSIAQVIAHAVRLIEQAGPKDDCADSAPSHPDFYASALACGA